MSQIQVNLSSNPDSAVASVAKLERRVEQLAKSFTQQNREASRGAKAAQGSYAALEKELRDNVKQLKAMEIGSKAFTDQKRKVDELTKSVHAARNAVKSDVAAQSGASALVGRFTSAIGATVGTIASVGAIAASLKSDLEAIDRRNENARLAEADFGQALASRTISNLPEQERLAVRPLALNLADELGMAPGGIAESLGTLRSSGAESILEAGEFLKEAAMAFPQDLAQAVAVAKGALIEARATGNRHAAQVIGGLVQAQAVSQVTSAEEFSRAFSAQTAAAVSVHGLTPEQAREEASFFSVLEPKSAEVAATAEKAFFRQVSQFRPETSARLKTGGTSRVASEAIEAFMGGDIAQRIQLLEQGGELRRQFIDSLADEGRNAITRRLALSAEDRATFAGIQERITGPQQAGAEFRGLQAQAQQTAAFAIAAGRRETQQTTADLRESGTRKLAGEIAATYDAAFGRSFDDRFGGTALKKVSQFGTYVEAAFDTSRSLDDVRRGNVEFLARTDPDAEDRAFLQQQVERLEQLESAMQAMTESNNQGNQILRQMLDKRPVEIQQQAPRPLRPPAQAAP